MLFRDGVAAPRRALLIFPKKQRKRQTLPMKPRGRTTMIPNPTLQQQMAPAAARTDFEYAALLRDRLERPQSFRDELVAFRGRVQDLSFIYRVSGFRGDDRGYIIRRGRIRKTLPHPKSSKARARVADQIESTFAELDMGPAGLRPEEAAEILLIAQWFRLRPRERKRTTPPDRWFAEKRPA